MFTDKYKIIRDKISKFRKNNKIILTIQLAYTLINTLYVIEYKYTCDL